MKNLNAPRAMARIPFADLAVTALSVGILFCSAAAYSSEQTNVDQAEHQFDDRGIPILHIENLGPVEHPAWTALYALAYGGVDYYTDSMSGMEDPENFWSAIEWLDENLIENSDGLHVWNYTFDSTYNDITMIAPWISAWAQAVGIQAFIAAYDRTNDAHYLNRAVDASEALMTLMDAGGLLFEAGDDVWFEEIPNDPDNPSHILNGHMRALIALYELSERTDDSNLENWVQRGTDTLYRWLPLFDTGYTLRYDLNPRKSELLFRFANPYGFPNADLAIDRITIRDPMTGDELELDVGSDGDGSGPLRLSGIDWSAAEDLDGRTIRRLEPTWMETEGSTFGAPHTYFYASLPSDWSSNLRSEWLELQITYFDEFSEPLTVQKRSIAPGPTFRDLRDGDLHQTGAHIWRNWVVPVRPSDLGYEIDEIYAEKHLDFLTRIAEWDNRFAPWRDVVRGYHNRIDQTSWELIEQFVGSSAEPHPQTPPVPIYAFDDSGVLMHHMPNSETRWNSDGTFDSTSSIGVPIYSPFLISQQLIHGNDFLRYIEPEIAELIERQPAIEWLFDEENYFAVNDSHVYFYNFPNVYNNILSEAPWASAFGQANILAALRFAYQNFDADGDIDLHGKARLVAHAFNVHVSQGGISTRNRNGEIFFEEVPNATHVLNGHLISLSELLQSAEVFDSAEMQSLAEAGLNTLRNQIHLFDTGNWLRYDLNPREEMLLRIGWIGSEESPLISHLSMRNPVTNEAVSIDVGAQDDAEGQSRVTGIDWLAAEDADGRSARRFRNGFLQNETPVTGGSRQNAYINIEVPLHDVQSFFDTPVFELSIDYLDTQTGTFSVESRTINNGNEMVFIPFRSGVWSTGETGQWHTRIIEIRPQDLGWYKGPAYQEYEVAQLDIIGDYIEDWFLEQYSIRHNSFLETSDHYIENLHDSLQFTAGSASVSIDMNDFRIVEQSSTYPGFDFSNSFDGDPFLNYTAGINTEPAFVVVEFEEDIVLGNAEILWENEENFASELSFFVSATDNGQFERITEVEVPDGTDTTVLFDFDLPVRQLRIEFSNFMGQDRLLLRQIRLNEATENDEDSRSGGAGADEAYLDSDKIDRIH